MLSAATKPPVHIPTCIYDVHNECNALVVVPKGASAVSAASNPIEAISTSTPPLPHMQSSAYWSTSYPSSRCDVVCELTHGSSDPEYMFLSSDDRSATPSIASVSHVSVFYLLPSIKWGGVAPQTPFYGGGDDSSSSSPGAVGITAPLSIPEMSDAVTALVSDISLSGGARRHIQPDGTMYHPSDDGLVSQVVAKTALSSIFDHKDRFSGNGNHHNTPSKNNNRSAAFQTTDTASGWLLRLGKHPQGSIPSLSGSKVYVLVRLQCVWEPQRPIGLSYLMIYPYYPNLEQLFLADTMKKTLQQRQEKAARQEQQQPTSTTATTSSWSSPNDIESTTISQLSEKEQQDELIAWAMKQQQQLHAPPHNIQEINGGDSSSLPKSLSSYTQDNDAYYFQDVFYSQKNNSAKVPVRTNAQILSRMSSTNSTGSISDNDRIHNIANIEKAAAIANISAVVVPSSNNTTGIAAAARIPSIGATLNVMQQSLAATPQHHNNTHNSVTIGQKRGRGTDFFDDDATPPEGDLLVSTDVDDDATPPENDDDPFLVPAPQKPVAVLGGRKVESTTPIPSPQVSAAAVAPSPPVPQQQQQLPVPVATPTPSSPSATTTSSITDNKPLSGVVFILSGYQNPLRATIRDKAIAMGAIFLNDWDATKCTHLVCAVANTPKYNQVVQCAVRPHAVYIVDAKFIEACHNAGAKVQEGSYGIGVGVLQPIL